MILWIFESAKIAKERLSNKKLSPKIWDRIICLWTEQSTYQWNWKTWLNINWIFIIWERWDDGIDGKNWNDWESINEQLFFNKMIEKLKLDESFQKKIKWEQGKQWEKGKTWQDANCDINYIIEKLIPRLIDNKYFVEKCRAKDGKNWKDGENWLPWLQWLPWKDGKDGENAIDGMNWSIIHIVPKYIEWKRDNIDICIDDERNIYFMENNWVKKIPINI
jgi:hypothetical protein